MQRRFPQTQLVSAVQNSRLARGKSDGIVNYCAVNRSQIFDEKRFSFTPNPGVTARDFGFGIEARKIDLRKNIGMRISATQQVVGEVWKMSAVGFEPTPTEVDCDLNAAP